MCCVQNGHMSLIAAVAVCRERLFSFALFLLRNQRWLFFSVFSTWNPAAFPSRLLQTSPTAQKENIPQEIFDTLTGACLPIACFIAWPWSRAALGQETALRTNLEECSPYGSVVLYLLKAVAGLLAADAYNYWKHRIFHSRALWPFHKVGAQAQKIFLLFFSFLFFYTFSSTPFSYFLHLS